MTPVDGLSPPLTKNKKKPVKKPVPINRDPQKGAGIKNFFGNSLQRSSNINQKHRLVWMLSIGIVVIIFIIWSASFLGGKIVSDSSSDNSNIFESFSSELSRVWKSFKSDYLKIKDTAEENPQTEEERNKQLEEKVFPSFDQNN